MSANSELFSNYSNLSNGVNYINLSGDSSKSSSSIGSNNYGNQGKLISSNRKKNKNKNEKLNENEIKLGPNIREIFLIEDGKSINKSPFTIIKNDDEIQESRALESQAYYEYYKILSNSQYGSGKRINEFISDFQRKYSDIQNSCQFLPKPLEELINMLNEIVNLFYQQHNFSKIDTFNIAKYCRNSVEKYLFSKLFSIIHELYLKKYQESNNLYMQISERVKKMNLNEIVIQLQLNENIMNLSELQCGVDQSQPNSEKSFSSEESKNYKNGEKVTQKDIQSIEFINKNELFLHLNRIEELKFISEKVREIKDMYSLFKVNYLDKFKV